MCEPLFTAEQADLSTLLLSNYIRHHNLIALNLVNKHNNAIISSHKFHTNILKKLHTDFLVPEQLSIKKCIELYKEVAKNDDIKLLNYAEKHEYIAVLEWLVIKKKSIFSSGANLLAKHGRLDLLQQLRYTYPDSRGLAMAVNNNHFELTNWVTTKIKIFPDPEMVIVNGNFEKVKELFNLYLASSKDISEYCTIAMKHQRIDILDWCADHNVFPGIHDLNVAAANNKSVLLKWAAKHNKFPDATGSEMALANKHFDTVLWLNKKGIKPNNLGTVDVGELKMLLDIGIGPSIDDYKTAVEKNNLIIIELFLQYGYQPPYQAVDIAIADDNIEILDLFDQYEIPFDPHNIKQVVLTGNIRLLTEKKLVVTVADANRLCGSSLNNEKKIMILELLAQRQILPNSNGANLAFNIFNDFTISIWLAQHKILPDHKGITMLLALMNQASIQNGNTVGALQFFINHRVYPSQYDVNLCLFIDISVLQVLVKNNLFPEPNYVRDHLQFIDIDKKILLHQYGFC